MASIKKTSQYVLTLNEQEAVALATVLNFTRGPVYKHNNDGTSSGVLSSRGALQDVLNALHGAGVDEWPLPIFVTEPCIDFLPEHI